MFAKDGLGIIIGSFVVFLLSLGIWYIFPSTVALVVTAIFGIFSIFNLFFFRDPNRVIPNNQNAVLSPADGKVMNIRKIKEDDYFQTQVQRISIFLSVFNVHVNRTPIGGTVDYFSYRTGKFLAAFKDDASRENEQTAIGMTNPQGHRVLFKQIAGLIARRIICHLREGQTWESGKRMGLIRYGSRVDVFIPIDAKVLVKKGQTVKGGESILATFPNGGDQPSIEETIVEIPKTEISP